jgi:co-chaperonin GroES (HSP10)
MDGDSVSVTHDSYITLRPGTLLIAVDPPEDRTASGILYCDVEKVYASTGLVLLHEPSDVWTYLAKEPSLTQRRIVFQKWSTRNFEWKGATLSVLKEATVLAVFGETHMNREELKTEIVKWIDENYMDVTIDLDMDDVAQDLLSHLENLDEEEVGE